MRTRLRRLRIDGRDYTWRAEIGHVQGDGDCHRCVRVRVWGTGKTGCALQADLLSLTWPAPWGACAADGAYPTPEDVRALVAHGLRLGWDPGHRGGTFPLPESVTLPGFVVTARMRDPAAADPTARVVEAYERRPSV
ncbi:hypothetical protein FHR83_002721 [Actinoplanes campanulatus]|uniref:Uncharacterized protein n=1 Tax=Actinoplanes campanulatus TaxID=113559 RepID=A0A7W5AF35_9ACTN|nr:hypothetical protein [Actinoplanes campanulatus]MBB3095058.1 hypothetical protein [Actinoplanes campanulatus]GGN23170.1 hypothetical protein GCM10010109_38030 [Actinoplanes campanulatus]GID34662.1 hypothetical protein Aca09nite_11680 [Actinoplanes campanulatus]